MGTQTPEEVKEEMISKMGTNFGSLFYSLYNEITWLTFKWIKFRELYGTKESRIELMNKAAPFFFFTIQKVLWDNLLLGITRITDPAEMRGKKNITFNAIGQFIQDKQFLLDFENDLVEIITDSEFCRDWRNRRIAHLDYELSVNQQNAEPLKKATRQKFRLLMDKIQSLYNKVSFKYLGKTTAWQLLTSDRGAISLLYRIENGLRFEEEEYNRKLKGEWIKDDFESKV